MEDNNEEEGVLTAKRVVTLVKKCLLTEEELDLSDPDEPKPLVPIIQARGVLSHFGFSRHRIEENKEAIKELLDELPDAFHKDGGGGWSFLQACVDRNGRQWGEHRTIDELLTLGVAAGYVTWCLPRELWGTFPGGVPYLMVETGKTFPKKQDAFKTKLELGQFVTAARDLDPRGADVKKGMRGVIQALSNHFEDGCGPLVAWENGGMCNVYEGDVEFLKGQVTGVSPP